MRKWRIIGAFLIIMALLVMLIPAAEADAVTSTSAFSIKRGELVKYNGSDRVVTVPNTVTSIGKGAFENNLYVQRIVLPDTVEEIKAYAFWGCDNLKTVTLGKGLSSIGDFAFTNCTGLETMTIPENVHRIGIQSFSECKRFEDITIPPQVVEIREDAFDGDYLLNIHCEEGSYADKYAKDFYERQKKMTVYGNTVGNSDPRTGTTEENGVSQRPVNVPADGVYSGADVQQPVSQTENGTTIADTPGTVIGSSKIVANHAFVFMQGAPVLSGSTDNTPDYVAGDVANQASGQLQRGNIPERAHYRDETFTEVDLSEEVKEIGPFAYARSGLRQADFEDGLKKIDYAAFYHCDDLMNVTLPDSVDSVEAKAFAHTGWMDRFLNGEGDSDFLITGGVLMAYRGSSADVTVPDGVRVIAGEAFADHTEISRIILPESLQAINERAFAGCNIMNIQYNGNALSEETLEESVHLGALAAGPVNDTEGGADGVSGRRTNPLIWVVAGFLFLGGIFCILKERY